MRNDLTIIVNLENGKAQLECKLPEEFLAKQWEIEVRMEIWETAGGGRPIFYGKYQNVDQDPMTVLLLRPHLWNGRKDPYLYQVRAWLRCPTGIDSNLRKGENSGKFRDAEDFENRREVYWQQDLAIYDLRVIEKKGIYLNEAEFRPHIVEYRLPPQLSESGTQEEQMERDLERLARMGANAILFYNDGKKSERQEKIGQDKEGLENDVRQNPGTDSFYRLCLKRGFLVKDLWITEEKIPVYRGLPGEISQEMLLSADGRTLTERYYYYQAKWSSEPVLYPALSTLHRQENGLLSLTVYSNQKKVVLYVDGVLFLFQSAQTGEPEFIFEDIPAEKLPLHLAVEAGNLSTSLTISRI